MADAQYQYVETPIGTIELVATDDFLTSVRFVNDHVQPQNTSDFLKEAARQFSSYFSGNLLQFDLNLQTNGTVFQRQVWAAVAAIPHGKRISYSELSKQLGDINLSRAVGAANGANPLLIVVPCHRVVGNQGELTGYAGGLDRKQWLLDFESQQTRLDL